MINGTTFLIRDDVNVINHVSLWATDWSMNLITVVGTNSNINVSSLSYANQNHGDIGIALKWDPNDVLLIMYSLTNEDIYWMYRAGVNLSPWHKLSWTIV